jgi:hypothetical protein
MVREDTVQVSSEKAIATYRTVATVTSVTRRKYPAARDSDGIERMFDTAAIV